jgi:hypothetical protein
MTTQRRSWTGLCLAALMGLLAGVAYSEEDPGKAKIGRVNVTVYYATHGDPAVAGAKAGAVDQQTIERLRGDKRLNFKEYRMLGQDTQPLLRSYENWAQPLKPSDEVLVRFEARSKPTKKASILDVELWLGRKKILKMDARLEGKRPLFILGPEWRGGRLIIGVSLAS